MILVLHRAASTAFVTFSHAATGAALGIAAWVIVEVVAVPLISGASPMWTAPALRALYPHTLVWMVCGSIAAVALAAARARRPSQPAAAVTPVRIVVIGGGFAGVTTIRELEKRFGADADVSLTLVSDANGLLFTPMLAEVAGGSVEAAHISTPIRGSVRRTRVVRERVVAIDLSTRDVRLGDGSALGYDRLVVALGAVPNFFGNDALERFALPFKSLADAIRLRARTLDLFERADREEDPVMRRRLLTFVVAGGGFAGAELAGALNDFARGIRADYPRIADDEIGVVVVHAGERILPELSASLAGYAQRRMTARGVAFILGKRVADAGPGFVRLNDGAELAADTLVWTAGTTPHPIVRASGLACDKRGAAIVLPTLATGEAGVWALGDCAAVIDARDGKPVPPTAQFALREAKAVAFNLHAGHRGKASKPFRFDSLGALCVIGYQTACAELVVPFARGRSVRFSGFLAWLMWRTVYLAKLPGTERKVRVALDWSAELIFPRDIAQTSDPG